METKQAELRKELLNFKLDSKTRNILFGLVLLGIISFVVGYFTMGHTPTRYEGSHSNPAWTAYLIGTYIVFAIMIASIFYVALGHISGAYWNVTTRRIAESVGKAIPLVIVLFAILFFGMHDLYEWSHAEAVAKDHLLQHKKPILNAPAFIGILLGLGVLWSIFAWIFYGKSVKQDNDGDVMHTKFLAKLSGGFIVFFALSFSLASILLIMSLTPHWFSTMFEVYMFAGAYQTGLSFLIVLIYYLKKRGFVGDAINENHWHDIGKFLFGFSVFWGYVAISQFMLIWYANIPEETFFYEQRYLGGYTYMSYSIWIVKFFIPFLLLINRPSKRDLGFLVKVAGFMIFAEFVEVFWLSYPANFPTFSWAGFIMSAGVTLGLVALLGLVVLKILEKSSLVPTQDPRLGQSLGHHQ